MNTRQAAVSYCCSFLLGLVLVIYLPDCRALSVLPSQQQRSRYIIRPTLRHNDDGHGRIVATRLHVSTESSSSTQQRRQPLGVLKLSNPMKLVREQQQQQPQQGGRGNNERRPGGGGGGDRRGPPRDPSQQQRRGPPGAGGGGGRNFASASTNGASRGPPRGDSSGGGGYNGGGGPSTGTVDRKPGTFNNRAKPPGGAGAGQFAKKRKGPNDDGKPGRQSLRLGTSTKRGRSAEGAQRRGSLKKKNRTADKLARAEANVERRTVVLKEGPMSVSELAETIDEKPVAVIKFLMSDLGVMASMTQNLDPATCIAVVEGFGKYVAGLHDDDEDDDEDDDDDEYDEDSALATGVAEYIDDEDDLEPRPPVVTIMGHVDHGKTSLLDKIRNTRVTAGEAGGITQHIQAYQVEHNGKPITFIDTPGHAAFTDMRQRGANITDIVILVVAADDGVKQQTADSIVCARQAGVPLVIAINKVDLETADANKVATELTAYDILTEDFGGDVLCSEISAKQGTNLDDLLDKIMLQAEIQDLKANADRMADGIIIEANIEKGLGTVATTLIKGGTLKVGDIFVAGQTCGKVKALISTTDGTTRIDEAGPSMPVLVAGFEGIPSAGDILVVCDDEQTARSLAESRQRISLERESSSYQSGLFDSVSAAFGNRKAVREMCVVVKADVQGTAEALTRALRELKLENDEAVVTIKVLVSEAGEVSKSDIAIAGVTPGTTVLAFNVAASMAAMEDARALNIPIEYYSVVYDAIESVESRMQEILSPTPEGEYAGEAVVQEVFNIGGTGNIAGSRCTKGYLKKGANARVMRGDKILCETRFKTLRSFKAETDNIEAGSECGIGLTDFENFEAGDIIECYVE